MDDESFLFDWIRFYGAFLALLLAVGAVGSFAFVQIFPPEIEAWSLVVQTGTRIPPRQLGPVADTVFHSSVVYRPVMEKLQVSQSPQAFLAKSVDLRPVPDTNTLIVVGRSRDVKRAEQLSSEMAGSLVRAFVIGGGFEDFKVFSKAERAPVPAGISAHQAVPLGAGIAFWLGMCYAVFHYRRRSPLLNPHLAGTVSGVSRVAILEGSHPSWLGILRWNPAWKSSDKNHELIRTLVGHAVKPVAVAPGMGHRASDVVTERVARALGVPSGRRRASLSSPDVTILVCQPSTPQPDLWMAATATAGRLELVWVA